MLDITRRARLQRLLVWDLFGRSLRLNMFRVFLAIIFIVITGYTLPVIAEHGPNLFTPFLGDIRMMAWPGQFNVDFMCFLALSAVWVSWRHEFSAAGLGLGVVAFFGGAFFLSVYLLVASYAVSGDVRALLLGPGRSRA